MILNFILDESLYNAELQQDWNYNLDFIKAHTYTANKETWDVSEHNFTKIRVAGGMNGLNLSTTEVFDKNNAEYLKGGLIKVHFASG